MRPQSISLISTISSLFLGGLKIIFGVISNSTALIADGLHSGLDVISSFATFLGLKIAQKPVDEKHPYGYFKAETIAGFFVTLILALTSFGIIFEGIKEIVKKEGVIFSHKVILIILFSIIIQEIMSRFKFYYGRKFQAISLIADAKHSKADVFSSIGVLAGFLIASYYKFADGIIAILIGLYLLYEVFLIGREITDSLLDVANKEIEERIKKICHSHKIEISKLRTRKVGAFNFAEIEIKLPPKMKVEKVAQIIKDLEKRLLRNISELKYVIIGISPYNMKRTLLKDFFGKKFCYQQGFEKIGPEKLGKRIIIPLTKEGQIFERFGTDFYLVVDIENNEIRQKKVVKNPYFKVDSPKGGRFAKAIRADKVLTLKIGPNAKRNLEIFGIEVEILKNRLTIKELLEKLKEKEKKVNY